MQIKEKWNSLIACKFGNHFFFLKIVTTVDKWKGTYILLCKMQV